MAVNWAQSHEFTFDETIDTGRGEQQGCEEDFICTLELNNYRDTNQKEHSVAAKHLTDIIFLFPHHNQIVNESGTQSSSSQ